jgi:addiction module RelE/StbE family toxin
MINCKYHKDFLKSYSKLTDKFKNAVKERLRIFADDPFSIILNNHPLKGKYDGYRSINISGDLRAIYKELNEKEVIFVLIGTHSKLYKN